MASSLAMSIILSNGLVTLEAKATFNPHCAFSFNEAYDYSNYEDSSTTFKQQYIVPLKRPPTGSYGQITIHNVLPIDNAFKHCLAQDLS